MTKKRQNDIILVDVVIVFFVIIMQFLKNKKEIFMKRVLSIILTLAMLCCVLALTACGDENKPSNTTKAPGPTGSGTEAPTTASTGVPPLENWEEVAFNKRPGFDNVDFGDKVFTIAVPVGRGDGWENYDIAPTDENSPDPIDQAVLQRNRTIEDLYKCTIVQKDAAYPTSELTNDFATGRNTIDMVADRYALTGFAGGNYYNINRLNLDLTKDWYDQGFIRDMTIDGKLYALAGDFSIEAYDATWVMFVNLDVLENNEKTKDVNIFDLVRNYEWTLDKMLELCRYAQVNGGTDEMTLADAEDVFGLVSSSFQIRSLYLGTGNVFVQKTDDASGKSSFQSGFNNQSAVDATDLILEILADPSVSIPQSYTKVNPAFTNGQTLFVSEVMSHAQSYADTEARFSIIPEPMLSADQGAYYHNVDNHASYYAVPKTCADIEVMSNFIEVFAYHSRYISYREYLNLYKYTYSSAAEDSAEMVDIIVHSRRYDAGYELNWGGFAQTYTSDVTAGNNTVVQNAAKFDRLLQDAAKAYQEKINSYNDGIAS